MRFLSESFQVVFLGTAITANATVTDKVDGLSFPASFACTDVL